MRKMVRCLLVGAVAVAALVVMPSSAHAQYPVAVTPVQPVVPAVVGYTAERRGLFGWRTDYRPVVAGVPTVPVAPAVAVAPPVVSQRVVVGYAPPVQPVTSYYAPPVTIAAPLPPPITTYRVPLPAVVPYVGY